MRKWRLPRLTRGQRTVRNLVLLPLVILLVWGGNRFCIRDPYLSFRRAEAQNLVGPSDIQAVVRAGGVEAAWEEVRHYHRLSGEFLNELEDFGSVDGLRKVWCQLGLR